MSGAVRERVRAKMRDELAQGMYPLFAQHGLEQVTVEQAARAVGISRATFFRYFSCKEDAVVTALRLLGAHLAATVNDLQALPGESLLELLRRSFEPSLVSAEHDPAGMREQVRLIWRTPSLLSAWIAFRREQQEQLATELSPFCASRALARTAAVTALTLYDHALECWLDAGDRSLHAVLDEVFDHVTILDDRWSARR